MDTKPAAIEDRRMRQSLLVVALLTSAPVLADAPVREAKPVAPSTATGAVEKINKLAAANNAGRPASGAWAGQFEEGQTLRQPVLLEPSKCYVVIAVGLDGIKELDAQLITQLAGMPPVVMAEDSTKGPDAILGDTKAGCFKYPLPRAAPATVVVRATRGAGVAAAQLFAK